MYCTYGTPWFCTDIFSLGRILLLTLSMYNDKQWKEQQIMSYLHKSIYMELNNTIAGICQLSNSNPTKVQAACFLDALGKKEEEAFKPYLQKWIEQYI